MKAKILIPSVLCILSLCFFLMWMSVYSLNHSEESSPAEAQDRWLILLYDDGDFNNGFDALYAFADEAYAHENLDILVMQDNFWSPAMMWQIGTNHEMIPVKFLGEINMADAISLEYFLKYADSRFPGRRVLLCFYDHGGGWWGACIDETNIKKDSNSPVILSPANIRSALEKSRSVDLICFTAPCLMGSIEAAYELRHNTEAYVGSENTSGYCYWLGTIRFICDILNSRPNISNHELAQAIVESTAACSQVNFPDWFRFSYTMAAVRSDKLDNAINAIGELCTAILDNPDDSFILFDQSLGDIRFYANSFADIIDLFEEAIKRCQNPSLWNSFQKAIDSVRQVVLAEAHGSELYGSNGLNVYFPPPPDVSFSMFYGDIGNSFAHDAGWFEFLKSYRASWPNASVSHTGFIIPQTNGFYPPFYNTRWLKPARRFDPSQKTRDDQ
jgi:hypothetical protein